MALTAGMIIRECRRRGVAFRVEEARLIVACSPEVISPEIRGIIAARESELVEVILAETHPVLVPGLQPLVPGLGGFSPSITSGGLGKDSAANPCTNGANGQISSSINQISPLSPPFSTREATCKGGVFLTSNLPEMRTQDDHENIEYVGHPPYVADRGLGGLSGLRAGLERGNSPLTSTLIIPYSRPAELANWPLSWRQRWADRTAEHEAAGLDWKAAERRAFDEMLDDGARPGRPGPIENDDCPAFADDPTLGVSLADLAASVEALARFAR